jgi:NAD+ kinase
MYGIIFWNIKFGELLMKTIGIIPNADKDIDLKVTRELIAVLQSLNCNYLLPEEFSEIVDDTADDKKRAVSYDDLYKNADYVFCLGGDGTFLNISRKLCSYKKPVLGINLGTLGFLTEIDKNEIKSAAESIISEDFSIEERIVLSVSVQRGKETVCTDIAVNDFVVSRTELSRILHLKTYINSELFDDTPGDGLIISTPTGSTAYSLSAGGPIVEPHTNVIIMTPICSHTLNSRPLITSSNTKITVEVDENYTHGAMLTVDGQTGYRLMGGDRINIRTHEDKIKLIKLNNRSFISILRSKIYKKEVQDEI